MKRYSCFLFIILTVGILFPVSSVMAQQKVIKGIVVNSSGTAVEGATITVFESKNVQTKTNKNGLFKIIAETGQHLLVSDNGNNKKNVTINKRKMHITLDADGKNIHLSDGITREPDGLTSSVGVLNGSQIKESMVINPANALYGRIPGLTVLGNGGTPPTDPTLLVRGMGTFTNSAPLVLVDGFEWPLSTLSVSEIKKVDVLKDAAALAKYGQQGANGVILVTTKRGTEKGLNVSASYQQAVTQPTNLPDMVGAPVYVRAVNEARFNDGLKPRYGPTAVRGFENGKYPTLFPNVNWFNKVLRNYGTRSKFNANFSGGAGSKIHYFTSMNFANDIGLFGPVSEHKGYSTQLKYSRFHFLTNLDIKLTSKLRFKFNVNGSIDSDNKPGKGGGPNQIFSAMYTLPSAAFPVRNADGSFGGDNLYGDHLGGGQLYGNNPYAMVTETGFEQPDKRNFTLAGTLHQNLDKVIKGLSAAVAVNYRVSSLYWDSKGKKYSYKLVKPVKNQAGNIIGTTAKKYGQKTDLDYFNAYGGSQQYIDSEGKINYKRTIGNNNNMDATILFHQSKRVNNGVNNTWHRQNIFGNIHFGFSNKYFFEASASYSGNNQLPPGNKFELFPAVSAGWLLSNENFLAGTNFLNKLKLRASYGIVGSDASLPRNAIYIQKYDYASGYNFTDDIQSVPGFGQDALATTNLTNELSHITNIGIVARLVNNLSLTADLFYDHRTNILVGSEGYISDVIGIDKPQRPDGVINNKGLDATLKWQDEIGNFAYLIGGQFSYARSKIINQDEGFHQYSYLRRTGHTVGQFFGLQATGFFKNEQDIAKSPTQNFSPVKPGDIKYKDQNGDNIIDNKDEVPLGYSTDYPQIYYSISLGFSYKRLKISALFQGTGHYTAFLDTKSVFWPLGDNFNTISKHYYNHRWTANKNGTATLPRLTTGSNKNNNRPNSLWMTNRSYLKLRNAQVSYLLPPLISQKLSLNNIQIFVQGENLFSIDNIPVLNPEMLWAAYPILRSYSAGLKIAF